MSTRADAYIKRARKRVTKALRIEWDDLSQWIFEAEDISPHVDTLRDLFNGHQRPNLNKTQRRVLQGLYEVICLHRCEYMRQETDDGGPLFGCHHCLMNYLLDQVDVVFHIIAGFWTSEYVVMHNVFIHNTTLAATMERLRKFIEREYGLSSHCDLCAPPDPSEDLTAEELTARLGDLLGQPWDEVVRERSDISDEQWRRHYRAIETEYYSGRYLGLKPVQRQIIATVYTLVARVVSDAATDKGLDIAHLIWDDDYDVQLQVMQLIHDTFMEMVPTMQVSGHPMLRRLFVNDDVLSPIVGVTVERLRRQHPLPH